MATARKKTATKRRAAKSAASPALDLGTPRTFAASHLRSAAVAEKFGNASFSIGGKVFAFTRPDGLVLKLPPEALAKLLATREAQLLIMGKRVMREWALLSLPARETYTMEVPLLQAAMEFVQSLEK